MAETFVKAWTASKRFTEAQVERSVRIVKQLQTSAYTEEQCLAVLADVFEAGDFPQTDDKLYQILSNRLWERHQQEQRVDRNPRSTTQHVNALAKSLRGQPSSSVFVDENGEDDEDRIQPVHSRPTQGRLNISQAQPEVINLDDSDDDSIICLVTPEQPQKHTSVQHDYPLSPPSPPHRFHTNLTISDSSRVRKSPSPKRTRLRSPTKPGRIEPTVTRSPVEKRPRSILDQSYGESSHILEPPPPKRSWVRSPQNLGRTEQTNIRSSVGKRPRSVLDERYENSSRIRKPHSPKRSRLGSPPKPGRTERRAILSPVEKRPRSLLDERKEHAEVNKKAKRDVARSSKFNFRVDDNDFEDDLRYNAPPTTDFDISRYTSNSIRDSDDDRCNRNNANSSINDAPILDMDLQRSVDMSVQVVEGQSHIVSNRDRSTRDTNRSSSKHYKTKHNNESLDDVRPFSGLNDTKNDDWSVITILDKMERFRNSDGKTSGGERWQIFGSLLQNNGTTYEPRVLPCGDVLFVARNRRTGQEQVLDYIIERKTVDDYASSVKDGRLAKQAYLLSQSGLKQRMFVVEGDLKKLTRQYNDPQMHKKLAELEVSESFHVVYTNDISETVSFYTSIYHRLQLKMEKKQGRASEAFVEYKSWIERMKTFSSGITLQQLFVMQLCQTPGVGDRRARAVTKGGFKTVQSLHRAYKRLDGKVKEQEAMLGIVDGVGGAASKALCKLFTWTDYGTIMASSHSRSASASQGLL